MGYRFAPVEPEMVGQIAKLEREIFSDPWSERELTLSLENPAYLLLAAIDDQEEVFGYAIGTLLPPEGEIFRIAVTHEWRRHGIGWELLDLFIGEGRCQGCERCFLEVRESNIAARGLYEAFGFREYGRRKNYYRHPTEDAILMILGKESS